MAGEGRRVTQEPGHWTLQRGLWSNTGLIPSLPPSAELVPPAAPPPTAGKESIPSSNLFNPSRFDVELPSPPTSQPIGNTVTLVWPPGGTYRGGLGPEGGSTGHPRPVTPRLREGSHNLAQPGLNSQHTSEDTLPCFKSNYNIIV